MSRTSRLSRRGAVIVLALLVFATPAFAAVIVQNFMTADVVAAPACFNKTAGADTALTTGGTNLVEFSANPLTDTTVVDGVTLLEEALTIRGMTGDRVTYTHIVNYVNNCDFDLSVQLVNATEGAATFDAGEARVELYLSEGPGPTEAIGVAGGTTAPGTVGWDTTPIVVDGAGTIATAQTGSVVVTAGTSIQGGVVVSIEAGTVAATTVGQLNWVATATA